jgi:hypothetical protein
MTRPHELWPTLADGHVSYEIVCPGTDVGGCGSYESEGRCICPACHEAFVTGDDPGCWYPTDPSSAICGVIASDSTPEEMLHGNGWPARTYPFLASVDWLDGYPMLTPWTEP